MSSASVVSRPGFQLRRKRRRPRSCVVSVRTPGERPGSALRRRTDGLFCDPIVCFLTISLLPIFRHWRSIMSFQDSVAVPDAAPARGRGALIGLWTAQVALAGMFLLAGGSKLGGAPQIAALFGAIGVRQWFRYLTGAVEGAS